MNLQQSIVYNKKYKHYIERIREQQWQKRLIVLQNIKPKNRFLAYVKNHMIRELIKDKKEFIRTGYGNFYD